ncbi:PTP type protein phosphatase [Trinorchestia longiramus]|nr:PTP type protein phosphatase [Trinorchestia longiramus]
MKYSTSPSPSTTPRPSTVPTTTVVEVLSTSSDFTSTVALAGSELSEAPQHSLIRRSPHPELQPVVDGALSPAHNYSGFLILSVNSGKSGLLHRYSEYFNVVLPVMSETPPSTATPSNSSTDLTKQTYLIGALCVLALLIIITLVLCALLIFYKRRNKHLEDELVYSDTTLGRKLFRSLRKSNTLLSQNSIEVKPIAKDDLVMVYLENIKDSELGFRREYEALPEKLVDRSTRVSEMLENCSKNRYPDIKAYDQTRVKLNVSAAHPSDYINANFVLGYKERKKFICAQGPMDGTVDDFWRMIVEQGCGICVMLTNLEENGKVKCVKYWPEAGQPKTFGNITVRLVKEKSYADYIVRTLRAEWMVQSVSSNVDLSNKNIVGGEGSTSTNTSNASNTNHSSSGSLAEELKYHEVEQYHYLMWKDFVAPEHPVGILAFLRRMNEAYSHEKGPLLVHCSAGVGRTGTLVALDSLVQELDDERQASVYNLICDLRHQRNFLVQSLKQYVFIHRALMEYAQFGSTEQTPHQLREAYIKHVSQVQVQHSSPVLFEEFDLLSKVIEERKAFTIATSEENKSRNRYDYVLPYDSNRVILSPVAGKPVNTYINASFVSGFDLDEHFIVTQDPMENTVADFWRMIFEQDVTTIVMLSELGSGDHLCARYWPEEDDDAQHDNITVKLLNSESYPKFSSRVFQLSHNKNGDSRQITQFQYVGWSGMMGEVPVGTYGIMEMINRVQSHVQASLSTSMPAPVVVHCSGGGDRCSVYVCLNNCLRQLRREARVDVFQIARKIRSMRQFMLQEPTQYEFCYKALIEYIDSKGLDNI